MISYNCNTDCLPYYDLGCISICSGVCLSLQAPYDGVYTYEFKTPIGKLKETRKLLQGEKFEFSANNLNEEIAVELRIYTENGSLISFTEDNCVYDYFRFETEITTFAIANDAITRELTVVNESSDLGKLDADPSNPEKGDKWFNSIECKYKYFDGVEVKYFDTDDGPVCDAFGVDIGIDV